MDLSTNLDAAPAVVDVESMDGSCVCGGCPNLAEDGEVRIRGGERMIAMRCRCGRMVTAPVGAVRLLLSTDAVASAGRFLAALKDARNVLMRDMNPAPGEDGTISADDKFRASDAAKAIAKTALVVVKMAGLMDEGRASVTVNAQGGTVNIVPGGAVAKALEDVRAWKESTAARKQRPVVVVDAEVVAPEEEDGSAWA